MEDFLFESSRYRIGKQFEKRIEENKEIITNFELRLIETEENFINIIKLFSENFEIMDKNLWNDVLEIVQGNINYKNICTSLEELIAINREGQLEKNL